MIAAAWEAAGSWLSARAATTLVSFTGREPVETPTEGRIIREAEGRIWRPSIIDQSREELAPAMRVSPNSMGNRIHGVRTLIGHPRLLAQVESGGCSAWTAKMLLGQVESLSVDAAAWVVNRVVDRIEDRHRSGKRPWTTGEIRDCTKRLRLRLSAKVKDEAREQAKRDRKVEHRPGQDGMADVVATISEVDAYRIYRRLSALAVGMDDPDRTRDQLRADLLTDLLLFGGGVAPSGRDGAGDTAERHDGENPDRHAGVSAPRGGVEDPSLGNTRTAAGSRGGGATEPGHPAGGGAPAGPGSAADLGDRGGVVDPAPTGRGGPGGPEADLPARQLAAQRGEIQVNVVVTLAALLGLTDDPAEIPGLGPIPADVARELAADAAWRAWVTDTAGTVVATSSSRYTPTESLARLIRARESRCRMLGCRRPSERSELDHVIPSPKGRTSTRNLGPLCKRHHQLKTHGGWLQWPDQPDFAEQPPARRSAGDQDGGDRLGHDGRRDDGADGDPRWDPEHGPPPNPDGGPTGWIWRTPAGFLIHAEPEPPLGDLDPDEPEPRG